MDGNEDNRGDQHEEGVKHPESPLMSLEVVLVLAVSGEFKDAI